MKPEADMRTHVLILLCGISPAIVTETVFALAQSGDLPKQIIIITTITGEVCLRKELWDSGVWASLTAIHGKSGYPDHILDCRRT